MFITLLGRFLGLFVLLLGIGVIAGGIYVGIWEMLVGGITGLIDQIKAPTTDSAAVAWSIVKIIFCEIPIVVGIMLGVLLCSIGGTALFHKSD